MRERVTIPRPLVSFDFLRTLLGLGNWSVRTRRAPPLLISLRDLPRFALLVRIVQSNVHGVVQPNEWSDPHRAELLVLVRLGPAHGLSISLLDPPRCSRFS